MKIHSNSASITTSCLQRGFNAPFPNGDGTYDVHCNPLSVGSVGRDCNALKTTLQGLGATVDSLTSAESQAPGHDKS